MQIYLQQDGASAGPFDETAVRERLHQGTLTPDVYAWREGLSHWQTLGEVLAVLPPSFHAAASAPLPPVPAMDAAVKGRRMPWWGKTLLGCGGLVFVLLVALVLFAAHLIHVSREADRNRSPIDQEIAEQEAKSDKAWNDVRAAIERDMADPEHYKTTKVNTGDGGTTTTITPKGNVPGGRPITQRVDGDGEVTTSWTDAEGNTVKRSEDKNHNVRTVTAPAERSGKTSQSPSGNLEAGTREADQRAAEGGDAMAQVRIGLRYLLGKGGVTKDHKTAYEWFRRAAEAGNPIGEAMLGAAYEEGEDALPRDEKQAARWYELAAAQGNAVGQFSLGKFYKDGRGGLPRDAKRAVTLFQQAVEQGFADAEVSLGDCYEEGAGLPRDLKQAFAHYLKAVDQGNADALYKVGQCYENGKGTDRDLAKAQEFYRQAVAAGSSDASDALAKLDKGLAPR